MSESATIVGVALKNAKSKKGAQKVQVVNTPEVTIADKPYKPAPSLRLTSEDLPAIKDWKVGQNYKLTVEVQMKGINQGSPYEMVDDSEDKADKKVSANFKVTSVRES